MANTLTNVMPKILARGLLCLRQVVLMPRAINSHYSEEAAKKGDVVNIPKSRARTPTAVTPAATPPAAADSNFDNTTLTLDQWYHDDCRLDDKELFQIEKDAHFLPMQMAEIFKGLANQVNRQIFGLYKGVYGYVGTAGTTPFTSDVTAATNARKVLNQQLAPRTSRTAMINHDAEALALALAAFRDVSQSGKDTPVIDGQMGRFFGIDWNAEDDVPTHTAGTCTGLLVNNGAGYAIGSSTITTDTGSGTVLAGDIVTIAGHTQTYAIVSSVGGGTVTSIVISPPLVAAIADNAAITLKATHVVNLVFQQDAFGFATRPLASSVVDNELTGSRMMTMTDEKSGLSIRLEVMRQYKQTVWDFDILWGSALVRPELCVRIAG